MHEVLGAAASSNSILRYLHAIESILSGRGESSDAWLRLSSPLIRLLHSYMIGVVPAISAAWQGPRQLSAGRARSAVQLSERPLSLLAETDPAVFGVLEETLSVKRPDGVVEAVPVQRFVECDVPGMTFPLQDISERLYASNGPWPERYPFPEAAFVREDEDDDDDFYSMPRFCYHIDEGAVRAITNYYKEAIPEGSRVLDICSSWVSHYPTDFPAKMSAISATGMNALELEQNVQLSDFAPKNLNADPTLPYEDESFDVVTCVVSVDYLTRPLEVFKEVNRVLKPGGKFILSQSNRCFPSKAIAMWLGQSDHEHCLVVAAYFHYSQGWERAKMYDASPLGPRTADPIFVVEARKGSAEPPKLDASRWLKKKTA